MIGYWVLLIIFIVVLIVSVYFLIKEIIEFLILLRLSTEAVSINLMNGVTSFLSFILFEKAM